MSCCKKKWSKNKTQTNDTYSFLFPFSFYVNTTNRQNVNQCHRTILIWCFNMSLQFWALFLQSIFLIFKEISSLSYARCLLHYFRFVSFEIWNQWNGCFNDIFYFGFVFFIHHYECVEFKTLAVFVAFNFMKNTTCSALRDVRSFLQPFHEFHLELKETCRHCR